MVVAGKRPGFDRAFGVSEQAAGDAVVIYRTGISPSDRAGQRHMPERHTRRRARDWPLGYRARSSISSRERSTISRGDLTGSAEDRADTFARSPASARA